MSRLRLLSLIAIAAVIAFALATVARDPPSSAPVPAGEVERHLAKFEVTGLDEELVGTYSWIMEYRGERLERTRILLETRGHALVLRSNLIPEESGQAISVMRDGEEVVLFHDDLSESLPEGLRIATVCGTAVAIPDARDDDEPYPSELAIEEATRAWSENCSTEDRDAINAGLHVADHDLSVMGTFYTFLDLVRAPTRLEVSDLVLGEATRVELISGWEPCTVHANYRLFGPAWLE